MKKATSTFAALVIISGLFAGCGKTEKSEPDADKGHEHGANCDHGQGAPQEPKASNAKKWEPETATQPKAHDVNDGQDHSGHNH